MEISKTRAEALAALEGTKWDCDINKILDKIYGPELPSTNADEPGDGDNGAPPR